MYLIYVLAKAYSPKGTTKREKAKMPEHDLKPVMVAINRIEDEFFVREHDSRRSGTKQDRPYNLITRIYCRLREHAGKLNDKDQKPADAVARGRAQLAVHLSTIFFPASGTEPLSKDFVDHIMDRTRLADKIICAGYTGANLSMQKSEVLGLERARSVCRILSDAGANGQMVAMARPKCNYPKSPKLAHRVEVTALFLAKDTRKELASKKSARTRKAKKSKKANSAAASAPDADAESEPDCIDYVRREIS